MKTAAILASVAGLAAMASGQTFSGAGGSIPDNGGSTTVFTSDILVGASGGLVDLDVNIEMAHTWVGDLVITLTHVDSGTSVVMVDRPGVPDTGAGFSWDLDGSYDFDDASGAGTWDDQGPLGGSTDILASGAYNSENALAAFNGEDFSGTWRLTIGDNAGFDTGAVASWSVTGVVPAPASVAMLGLGGLVATRRRR